MACGYAATMACNFVEPFDHSAPVHHAGLQVPLRDWPDECVWRQLQYERWLKGRGQGYTNTLYLSNLEDEWARRGVCSRCHREIDRDLDEQVSGLESRSRNAEDKLSRIRRVLSVTSDSELRPNLMSILDEQ